MPQTDLEVKGQQAIFLKKVKRAEKEANRDPDGYSFFHPFRRRTSNSGTPVSNSAIVPGSGVTM